MSVPKGVSSQYLLQIKFINITITYSQEYLEGVIEPRACALLARVVFITA